MRVRKMLICQLKLAMELSNVYASDRILVGPWDKGQSFLARVVRVCPEIYIRPAPQEPLDRSSFIGRCISGHIPYGHHSVILRTVLVWTMGGL